jgi:predicted porin
MSCKAAAGACAAQKTWARPGDLDNLTNTYRTNNTVNYTNANYAGLTFDGTYSFGGTAGGFSHNQIWSVGV